MWHYFCQSLQFLNKNFSFFIIDIIGIKFSQFLSILRDLIGRPIVVYATEEKSDPGLAGVTITRIAGVVTTIRSCVLVMEPPSGKQNPILSRARSDSIFILAAWWKGAKMGLIAMFMRITCTKIWAFVISLDLWSLVPELVNWLGNLDNFIELF